MSLTSYFYEPFYSFSDFDRLFDEAFEARNGRSGSQVQRRRDAPTVFRPRLDVHENKDANSVTATFEVPGLNKDDVNIDVHNNTLTVSGESKVDETRNQDGYAVRERHYGKFSRSIPLAQGVKFEDVKASLENGVLTVTFPKSAPESAPRKITIS